MQKEQEMLAALVRGKKVAFIGAGVSHKTLIRIFADLGAIVTLCDQKKSIEDFGDYAQTLKDCGVRLSLGETYMDGFAGQDIILRTPGFEYYRKPLQDAIAAGTMVTSEVELFFQLCPCPIVAVTGSDGKTTTTTLISEFLKAAGYTVWLGGNIGRPLLPLCRQMQPDDFAVVELSSFQLMDMTHSPWRAVITNLAPNHLDIHRDMQEYVDAKKNIFAFQKPGDLLILNADNAITAGFIGPGVTRCFSRQGKQTHVRLENGVIYRGGEAVLAPSDILIPGVHNVENYMAAMAAVEGIVPDEAICRVAKRFGGVEHRIELVRIKDGVRFYNDSIASSPSRTIAGLRSFPEKVLLIAGGYDKHIPYDVLGPEICHHVKKLYLNGATAGLIRAAVEGCPGEKPEIFDCGDFDSAVYAAARDAVAGDVVLMSPASAAFDQFKNFMVRGDHYKALVKEL